VSLDKHRTDPFHTRLSQQVVHVIVTDLLVTEPLFALPLSLLWLRERPVALAWSGAAIARPGALLLAFNA
jgi:drug/metabolite transporter (DMT)-like permease